MSQVGRVSANGGPTLSLAPPQVAIQHSSMDKSVGAIYRAVPIAEGLLTQLFRSVGIAPLFTPCCLQVAH